MLSEHRESVPIPPVTYGEGFHLRPLRALENLAQILSQNNVSVVLASGNVEQSIRNLDAHEFAQAALYRAGEIMGYFKKIEILLSLHPHESYLILSGSEADVQRVLEYTRSSLTRLVDGWNRDTYPDLLPFSSDQQNK